MDKIRLGNDIEMRWSIFTRDGDNKVPYNLEGRALTLSVVNRTGESEIEFFAEGNIVTGVFRGRDQRILGKHGVILRENNGKDGMRTIDACDAFELVACSCEEALGSPGTIQLFHLTFDSTIGAITGTIDPILNYEAEQAEAERKANEIIRKANEEQRIDNEKQRNVNEILRNIAEEERERAEQERIVKEDLRKADEAERKTNEESRLQGESERISSEEERLYAESIRVANENARIASEAKRAEAETARIEAEDKRIVSEKNRLSAESSRIANEDSRRANEDSRLSAEAKRVSAEEERQIAEEERQAKFASMVVQSTGEATDKVMSQKTVTEALNGKQDKLTAGKGISIDGDVISATLNADIIRVVDALPSVGEANLIYLVPAEQPSESDLFEEWVWTDKWERIGSAKMDLSNYATKGYVDTKISSTEETLVHKDGFERITGRKQFQNGISVGLFNSLVANEDGVQSGAWLDQNEDPAPFIVADPSADDHAATKLYVDKGLATKQNTLTAGNGISIEGNVISSSVAEVVDNIVNAGYVFAGVATPATDPSTPNAKVFYIANGKGTYSKFGGIEVTEDEVVVLYWDTAWYKVATGIASEEKLTELGQKVTDLEDKTDTTIVHTKNLADYASVMVGLFPDVGGTITQDAQVKSIKFSCKPSTTYTISKVVTKRFRVVYYNTDPVLFTQGAGVITSNSASAITITTAADSSYIVAYIYDGSVETLTMDEILASLQIEEGSVATSYETPGWTAIDKVARENNTTIEERIKTTEESVSNNSDKIKELQEILTNTTRRLETTDVVIGKYRVINGSLASSNAYFYTNPIKLHKGDRITTDTAIPTYSNVSYITRVDEENNFIEVLKPGADETEMIDFTITEDGYFSISALNSQMTLFVIYQNGIESHIDDLVVNVASVSPAPGTKLPAITDNPLSSIRRDAGYGAIIRKWGIIGDSLSSGEMQCYDNTSTSASDYKFLDMYQYSWGQVFARLIGAEAYNFSNGGQTTWGWLKKQGIVHDDSYIGGIGGGDWELAKQDAYKKDAYIIALGVNDRSKIASGDYVLGATSQIVSYDGTYSDIDDTSVNPKSFVRYYAGIIQRVKSIQPKAKIFCVTPLGSNYAEIAQAIRDIVEYYSSDGVYLIDLFNYIPEGYNVSGYMLNGHLSPMGYAYTAYIMNTYIDWIIRNNGSAFRDTALIGTEYRPDYL